MCRGGGGVRRVVADRVPWASGEAFIGAWCRMRPLIWWEVRFWNKNENIWGAGPYHSKSSFLGWYPAACARPPDLLGMMHPVRACVAGDLAAHHKEESRHQTIVDPRDTRQWNRTRLRPVNLS